MHLEWWDQNCENKHLLLSIAFTICCSSFFIFYTFYSLWSLFTLICLLKHIAKFAKTKKKKNFIRNNFTYLIGQSHKLCYWSGSLPDSKKYRALFKLKTNHLNQDIRIEVVKNITLTMKLKKKHDVNTMTSRWMIVNILFWV